MIPGYQPGNQENMTRFWLIYGFQKTHNNYMCYENEICTPSDVANFGR